MSKALRAAREPLFHFLVLGAFLFVLDALDGNGGDGNEIVVTEGRIQSLLQSFELVWQRPPTEGELRSLIEDYVREEVLYREAIAMGLDEDDAVIRRRLREKMEFFVADSSDVLEPTDEELARFLGENPGRFLAPEGRDSRTLDLSEIRDLVRRAWLSARRREADEAFYRNLREKYRVTVDLEGWERER